MRIGSITGVLLAAALSLGTGGCGNGEGGGVEGVSGPVNPSTVAVKIGTLATDSWGYTGSAAAQVAAPGGTTVRIEGHTLLANDARSVISGTSTTKVSFSSDPANLGATAQAGAPANFICYLDIDLGSATTTYPALSVSVDTGAAPGETLKVYVYDPAARKWSQTQSAVANSSGTIAFPVDRLALLGIFR